MSELPHQKVQERAYLLWQADGCPVGDDLQYWLKAETQLHTETLDGATPVQGKAPKATRKSSAAPKTAAVKKAATPRRRKTAAPAQDAPAVDL